MVPAGNALGMLCRKYHIPPLKISGIKRRANFVIMRRTNSTLNDYEMQHNAEVGLYTRPSILRPVGQVNTGTNKYGSYEKGHGYWLF